MRKDTFPNMQRTLSKHAKSTHFILEPDLYTCFSLQHNLSTYYLTKTENEHLKIIKLKMTTNYNLSIVHYVSEEQNMNTCFSKTVYEHLLLHVMHT